MSLNNIVETNYVKAKEVENFEIRSRDHPNYSIIKICQNTEKRHRDLRRLGITQTPERNHQLVLV